MVFSQARTKRKRVDVTGTVPDDSGIRAGSVIGLNSNTHYLSNIIHFPDY